VLERIRSERNSADEKKLPSSNKLPFSLSWGKRTRAAAAAAAERKRKNETRSKEIDDDEKRSLCFFRTAIFLRSSYWFGCFTKTRVHTRAEQNRTFAPKRSHHISHPVYEVYPYVQEKDSSRTLVILYFYAHPKNERRVREFYLQKEMTVFRKGEWKKVQWIGLGTGEEGYWNEHHPFQCRTLNLLNNME